MKKILFLFLPLFFHSCILSNKEVPNEKELLEQQLKGVNWNEVDEYPSFTDCDSLTNEQNRKQCFFDILSTQIIENINVDSLKSIYPKLDTLNIKITVNPNKTFDFETKYSKNTVLGFNSKLDSIIKLKLVNLPKVNPALKRGMPVKSQFILPIIVK